jgi:hypothetical protein
MPSCRHLDQLLDATVTPSAPGCQVCLASGGTWVHLRLCQTCGHVGCCDQSPNRHARAHAKAAGHPVIRSHQPGEDWAWCFVDSVEYDPDEDWDREGADLG